MFEEARAIVIGVNEYQDSNINNLSFPETDAIEVINCLKENGFYDKNIWLFSNDRTNPTIQLGRREPPTRLAIYKGLRDLAKSLYSQPKIQSDLVFVYFSGHCETEQDYFDPELSEVDHDSEPVKKINPNERRYLLPYDANLACLLASSIHLDEFKKMVNALRASQIALVVDACYAGSKKRKGVKTELETGPLYPHQGVGRIYMASSGGSQAAFESDDLKHGIYTYHFLEALRGGCSDENGIMYHQHVHDYISRNMKNAKPQVTVETMEGPGVALGIKRDKYLGHLLEGCEESEYCRRRALQAFSAGQVREDFEAIVNAAKSVLSKKSKPEKFEARLAEIDRDFVKQTLKNRDVDADTLKCVLCSLETPKPSATMQVIREHVHDFLLDNKANPEQLLEVVRTQAFSCIKELIMAGEGPPFSPGEREQALIQLALPLTTAVGCQVHAVFCDVVAGRKQRDNLSQAMLDLLIKNFESRYLSLDHISYNILEAALRWAKTAAPPEVQDVVDFVWQDMFANTGIRELINSTQFVGRLKNFKLLRNRFEQDLQSALAALQAGSCESAERMKELDRLNYPAPNVLTPEPVMDSAIPQGIRKCISDGRYAAAAQIIEDKARYDAYATAVAGAVEKGYLWIAGCPLSRGEDPYAAMAKVEVDVGFDTEQNKITKIMVFGQEKSDWDRLRSIENRLFEDWQVCMASNKEILADVANEIKINQSLPDFEALINQRGLSEEDILLLAMLLGNEAAARNRVEENLHTDSRYAGRGNMCRLLTLSYLAEFAQKGCVTLDVWMIEKAIGFFVLNLLDNAFWHEFRELRQKSYQETIESKNIEAAQRELKKEMKGWLQRMADEALSGGRAEDGVRFDELRLQFWAELEGARLLAKIGGIPLGSGSEERLSMGYKGSQLLGLVDQVGRTIRAGLTPVSLSGQRPLTSKEERLLPCLFSQYRTVAVLSQENPGLAVNKLEVILNADTEDYLLFAPVAVDLHIKLGEDKIASSAPLPDDFAEAIGHWEKACTFAEEITQRYQDQRRKAAVTKLQILRYLAGRTKQLNEKAQDMPRRESYRLNIATAHFIEDIIPRLFKDPASRKQAKESLDPILGSIYEDIGLILFNTFDDYAGGIKMLRKAMEQSSRVGRIRVNFLDAVLSHADNLFLKNRRTEAIVFYDEAKKVAEEGLVLHPQEKVALGKKLKHAELGIIGEFPIPEE